MIRKIIIGRRDHRENRARLECSAVNSRLFDRVRFRVEGQTKILKMAGRRVMKSAVDWIAFAERVPPNQVECFRAFKQKSEFFVSK